MAQIAVGVPALLLSVFAVVLAYRLTGRSLATPAPWLVVGGILAVFAVYFGRILLRPRNSK